MAGTRREPLARHSTPQITPVALAAFRQLRVLDAQCIGPPACEPYKRCVACEEWWVQQKIIHTELGLRPWEFPVDDGTHDWPLDPAACARWAAFEEAEKGISKVDTPAEPRRGRRKREPVKSENPNLGDADLPSPGEPVA